MAAGSTNSDKEHLKDLIEAENQARGNIAQARTEAETIKKSAQDWAHRHLEETRSRAGEMKQTRIKSVLSEMQEEESALSLEVATSIQAMDEMFVDQKEKLITAFIHYLVGDWDRERLESEFASPSGGGSFASPSGGGTFSGRGGEDREP